MLMVVLTLPITSSVSFTYSSSDAANSWSDREEQRGSQNGGCQGQEVAAEMVVLNLSLWRCRWWDGGGGSGLGFDGREGFESGGRG
ncbi:hypothetical protein OIU77_019895 [Salix suchowensis]|uniref:Secreted protein n=1 Tax=Salix suchowensis TaxID=1278906 RepID=A0ABQ9CLK0_9ROSI|nr:hypothetical protein OIU77_019895 [Salix suchowensis]